MSSLFFILGAPDAEMSAIEELLRQLQIPYALAASGPGQRIGSGQIPSGYLAGEGPYWMNAEGAFFVKLPEMPLVSVEVPGGVPDAIVVDHHDDHPLASARPEEAIPASSLGQVIRLLASKGVGLSPLGWEQVEAIGADQEPGEWIFDGDADSGFGFGDEEDPEEVGYGEWLIFVEPELALRVPDEIVAICAADHCLAAAFAGSVPGVAPETVQRIHCEAARARFAPSLTIEQYMAEVDGAIGELRAAQPILELDPEGRVRDLRALPVDGPLIAATGERYPSRFPHGPVAGALAGLGYVVRIERGREAAIPALRMGGCGIGSAPGAEPIARFLGGPDRTDGWAVRVAGAIAKTPPAEDAVYGVAERGYAGATLK